MAVKTTYTKLSEMENFQSGYIIVYDTLFQVLHRVVIASWDLYAKSTLNKINEARRVAHLSSTQPIVVDDLHVYDEYIVAYEGELITSYEAYKRMERVNHDASIRKCIGL